VKRLAVPPSVVGNDKAIGMVTEYTPKAGRSIGRAVDEDERWAGQRPVALDMDVGALHWTIVASG
jgi:hypothetical protein